MLFFWFESFGVRKFRVLRGFWLFGVRAWGLKVQSEWLRV